MMTRGRLYIHTCIRHNRWGATLSSRGKEWFFRFSYCVHSRRRFTTIARDIFFEPNDGIIYVWSSTVYICFVNFKCSTGSLPPRETPSLALNALCENTCRRLTHTPTTLQQPKIIGSICMFCREKSHLCKVCWLYFSSFHFLLFWSTLSIRQNRRRENGSAMKHPALLRWNICGCTFR